MSEEQARIGAETTAGLRSRNEKIELAEMMEKSLLDQWVRNLLYKISADKLVKKQTN
jgi:hypothetical protein